MVNGHATEFRPFFYRVVKPTMRDGYLVEVYDINVRPMGILSNEGKPLSFETALLAEAEASRRKLTVLRSVH